jgi:hypothetical protein
VVETERSSQNSAVASEVATQPLPVTCSNQN